jgi:adenosylcobinamide kinase/adenosylcobinamide-phosphate guanylyltransferase
MSGQRLIFIGGGARSGKSAYALKLARQLGKTRALVATMEGLDDELRDRIRRHQEERGADFETVEEPLQVTDALARTRAEVVIIDCLTLWVSNQLCRDHSDESVLEAGDELLARLSQRDRTYIVVTNEVGLGLVPEYPLGRRFRDLSGTLNQRFAAEADEVYFGAMGLLMRIKPSSLL